MRARLFVLPQFDPLQYTESEIAPRLEVWGAALQIPSIYKCHRQSVLHAVGRIRDFCGGFVLEVFLCTKGESVCWFIASLSAFIPILDT